MHMLDGKNLKRKVASLLPIFTSLKSRFKNLELVVCETATNKTKKHQQTPKNLALHNITKVNKSFS